ncbi:S-layer homology domain-containing protein [Solibacillus sp. FSL R5-0691]|uniref:S-layer homology domain-containing protein n=1 Tax=Solibacillus sp. FSL R5-0691 TaxID=2921653 RepID=UPI0030D45470
MKNKLLLSAMALAITTPAIVVPMTSSTVEAATYDKVFKDVTKNNVNYDIIHEMASQGVINGYEDGTFRGGVEITRQHAASLVYRYLGGNLAVVNKNVKMPSDLNEKNSHAKAVYALMQAGLLSADANNKVSPNTPLTRAEMAKILVVAFDVKIKAQYDFADTVEGDAETRDYVRALYSNGITTGYLEDATFRPTESLTRQQFAVFMHRSINVDPEFVAEPIELPKEEGVIDIPTTGYNPYELNLVKTPVSEYEKYSDKYADILANQKTPKVGNLSAEELSTFQAQQLAMYKEFLKADSNTTMPTFVAKEEFIEAFAQREGVSTADMIKIFNYVQSTGAVYKGNKMAIYYKYYEATKAGSYHKVERTR